MLSCPTMATTFTAVAMLALAAACSDPGVCFGVCAVPPPDVGSGLEHPATAAASIVTAESVDIINHARTDLASSGFSRSRLSGTILPA